MIVACLLYNQTALLDLIECLTRKVMECSITKFEVKFSMTRLLFQPKVLDCICLVIDFSASEVFHILIELA